ncbi:MAG: hypothetical protein MR051_02710, partial [Lentisphaeria bacterium]|nr:hypothetical protein [Lentisphaeria bacterium]
MKNPLFGYDSRPRSPFKKNGASFFGSSREFVGKSERDTSEPVVSQAAIRHNRSRWSLLFRLPFDSRQNL